MNMFDKEKYEKLRKKKIRFLDDEFSKNIDDFKGLVFNQIVYLNYNSYYDDHADETIYENQEVVKNQDIQVVIFVTENRSFIMYHDQSCCEQVYLEDIAGDMNDLIGSPIIHAEEVSNSIEQDHYDEYGCCSTTWTFYKLSTQKGSVTLRWVGRSNGCYSEAVELVEITDIIK